MSVAQLPDFTMRQLLEAGVHFGHQTHRWNPKMAPYIYGARNNIHIIDLRETVPLLHQALVTVRDVIGGGGRLLFVGTKRQASAMVADAAGRCGQYYVNHRWLGGMLTNWKTISNSIRRLRELDEQMDGDNVGFTKKELLRLTREREKLHRALGGIKDMGGLPDMLFVIDIIKEEIAVKEAIKLSIPIIGVVDTNVDPDLITYPVPGNDDAARAIELYLDLVSRSVLSGLQHEQQSAGVDIGAAEELPEQVILADAPAEVQVPESPAAEAEVPEPPAAEAQVSEEPPAAEAAAEPPAEAATEEAEPRKPPRKPPPRTPPPRTAATEDAATEDAATEDAATEDAATRTPPPRTPPPRTPPPRTPPPRTPPPRTPPPRTPPPRKPPPRKPPRTRPRNRGSHHRGSHHQGDSRVLVYRL